MIRLARVRPNVVMQLYGRQHLESVEAPVRDGKLKTRHRSIRRSAPCPFNHCLHRFRRARDSRLNAAVGAVANPAADVQLMGGADHKLPETHTLHAAGHNQVLRNFHLPILWIRQSKTLEYSVIGANSKRDSWIGTCDD